MSYQFYILKCQRYKKWDNSSNKINIKMTSMYNKIMEETRFYLFIIIVGGRSYLHEWKRLSN
jgi:hypothetical protein